jgi:hypothetical protein
MKTYEQLTDTQKTEAQTFCLQRLLVAIISGNIRFNDKANEDDLQARIDAACKKAEDMKTPWFAHEYIMDTCSEAITAMALCYAEDSIYHTERENVITLKGK